MEKAENSPREILQNLSTLEAAQGTETAAAGSRSNDAAAGSAETEVIGSEAGASKLPDSHLTDGAEIEGVPAVHNQQPLAQKAAQGTETAAAGSRSNDAAAGSAETEVIGSEAGASKLPDSHLADGAEIEGVPAVHKAGASKLPDSQLTDGAEIEGVPAVHNQQPLTQKAAQGTETEAAGSRSNDAAAGSAETEVIGSEVGASKLPDSHLTDGAEIEGVPAVHNQQPLTQKAAQGTETEAAGSRSNDAAAGSAETEVIGSEAGASKLPDSHLTDGAEIEGVPAVHNQQPLTQKAGQGTETAAAGSRSNDAAAGSAETEVIGSEAGASKLPDSHLTDGAEIEGVPAVHNQQPLTQKAAQGTETEAAGSRSNDAAAGSAETEVIGSEAGASKLPDSHLTDGAEIEGVPAVHNQQPLAQKAAQGTETEAAGSRSNDAAAGSAETEVIGSEVGASKLPDSHLTDGAEIEGVPAVHNQQPLAQKAAQGTETEAAGSRSNDAAAGSAETEVIGSEVGASKLPDSHLTDGAEIEGVPAVHNQQPLTQKAAQGTETEAAGSRSNDAAAGSAETEVIGSEAGASKLPDSHLTDGAEIEGVPAVHNQQPLTQKAAQGTETEAAGSRSNDAAAGSAETEVIGSEVGASKLPDSHLTDGAEIEGVPAVHNQQPLTQKAAQGTETEAAGSRSNDAAAGSAETEVIGSEAGASKLPDSHLTDGAEIEGVPAVHNQQPLTQKAAQGTETEAAGSRSNDAAAGSAETEVIGSEAGASKLPDSHLTDGAEIEGVPAVHNQQPLTQKAAQGTETDAGSRSNDAAAGSAETEIIGSEAGVSKLPDSHLTDGAEIEGVPAGTEAGSRSNDAAAAGTEVVDEAGDMAELEGLAANSKQALADAGEEGEGTAAARAGFDDDKLVDGTGEFVEKAVNEDDASGPEVQAEGTEFVRAQGIPLAGENNEFLEGTLLEALQNQNESPKAPDAEAENIHETSETPKFRWGWWRLSRVAPEPEFEVRHVVHYKDGVQLGPSRLERRPRSGYTASKASKDVEITRPGDGEA